jgi:hypothetical protein
MVVNGFGAAATALVLAIIAATKFVHGAWMVIVLIPIFIGLFLLIERHYRAAQLQLAAETPVAPEAVHLRAIVPIASLNVPARQALALAGALTHQATALYIADTAEAGERLRDTWVAEGIQVPLAIIESPYRSLISPILTFVDAVRQSHPQDTIMVILPEFVPSHWWEHFLHNQTALRLKAALLFHPGVVVASVPYHLRRPAAFSAVAPGKCADLP